MDKRNSEHKNSGDLGRFVVLNKDKIWEYEQEVRLIYDLVSTKMQAEVLLQNEGKNIDIPFDHKMISKVIFGCRSKEKNVNSIIQKFSVLEHYPKFQKMNLNPSTLKLEALGITI
ncbi:MAG: hypothetical protein LAT51_09935 [Flavobacteriaceae bacterium]|nr:hypothetical protein [Flavobacteriaceae bacterium]